MRWEVLSILGLLLWAAPLLAQAPRELAPMPHAGFDTTGYRTVRELITADPKTFRDTSSGTVVAGVLGVQLALNEQGQAVVDDVQLDSAAASVGLQPGDVILAIAGETVRSLDDARDKLKGRSAEEELRIKYERAGESFDVVAKLKAASKPFKPATGLLAERPVLGVQLEAAKEGGVTITSVTRGGGADQAGIKIGDIIKKIEDQVIENDSTFREVIGARKIGDTVRLTVQRAQEELELRATLAADQTRRAGTSSGWDDRLPRAWTKPVYRLAILGIEYPDIKHNPKITDADWQASMFSKGVYTDRTATGQKAYGSLHDYFQEISYGKLSVEGKFLGWTEVSKKRMEYSSGNGTSVREKTALLTETLDKYLAKHGKDALKDYDGIFFLFAGGRVQTTRGSLYWPHRATFRHEGKSWPYFIVQEGGDRMNDISVFCHEFGHMLGLPDLYARPEVPGMEGVGPWCAMSQQNGGGRPQHFSAWCKQELGWIKPVIIDPRVKQKVLLAPITTSPDECIKIPIRPDGSEYLLLENRVRKNFDADLPAEGLLIWRVMPGRQPQPVYLEEAHGIEGPSGPRQYGGAVPFPSPANNSFTPYTIPSSKSIIGGGFDVHITNITRLRDGRIAFQIGYEYQ